MSRAMSEDEKNIFHKIYEEYKEKTQKDREFVRLNYRMNPDNPEVREAMERIFDENDELRRKNNQEV